MTDVAIEFCPWCGLHLDGAAHYPDMMSFDQIPLPAPLNRRFIGLGRKIIKTKEARLKDAEIVEYMRKYCRVDSPVFHSTVPIAMRYVLNLGTRNNEWDADSPAKAILDCAASALVYENDSQVQVMIGSKAPGRVKEGHISMTIVPLS